MIDHVSIAVTDLAKSAEFYENTLVTIGLRRLVERPKTIGFGKKYPEFWLNARPGLSPGVDGTGAHICLRAPTQEAVEAFFRTAKERRDHWIDSSGMPDTRPGSES